MEWADLFDRGADCEATVDAVRAALDRRRAGDKADADGSSDPATGTRNEPSPARIVADADVLAADLLVGGPAREAVDAARTHSWVALVASDHLLDDAEAVIADVADPDLAADWRRAADALVEAVDHPPGDHPALASALYGGSMHVLTFDEGLQSAGAGVAIREHVQTSVKGPRAFARLFDPERLYPEIADGDPYPGPDRHLDRDSG